MTSSVSVYFPVYYCSKSILEEYCEISSLLTEELVKVHQEISAAVEQIDPLAEYQHFIDAYRSGSKLSSSVTGISMSVWPGYHGNRSPETPEASVEFESSLLEESENLPANEILWNTLTADNLQAMWAIAK